MMHYVGAAMDRESVIWMDRAKGDGRWRQRVKVDKRWGKEGFNKRHYNLRMRREKTETSREGVQGRESMKVERDANKRSSCVYI